MKHQNNYIHGLICTALGALSWGLSGTMSQYLFMNYQLNPSWLTMVRMLCAGGLLFALTFAQKKKAAFCIFKNKRDIIQLILFSVFGLLFCQYSYLSAIEHSNSGTATVLQTLSVVIVPFLVCMTTKKLPDKKEIFSIVLALAGVYLIATHGNPGQMVLSGGGLFWGICAALGAVGYSTLSERIVADFGSQAVTGYGMLIGGIFFSALARPWSFYMPMDASGLVVLILIILIGTIGAFMLFLKGVSEVGPQKAILIGALEPVSATVISALWLHTNFTPADVIGFVLILATVFLLTAPKEDA